jgi:hypothetical protein
LSKHGTGGRAASGAVGSVVGQIAKIKGCRVVGVGLLHLVELSAVAADQDDRAVLGQLFRQALAPRPPSAFLGHQAILGQAKIARPRTKRGRLR